MPNDARPVETPADARARPPVHTTGIVIVAVAAALAILYFGRLFFVPIAFALMLNAVFRPVVRRLQQWRVPAPAGATVVVVGLLAGLAAAGWGLSVPMAKWKDELPGTLDAAGARLARYREPVQKVQAAVERVANPPAPATAPTTGPTTAPAAGAAPGGQGPAGHGPAQAGPAANGPAAGGSPAPARPNVLGTVLGTTTTLLAGAVSVLLLLYLLLASGGMFLHKLVKVLPGPRDKAAAGEIVHEAEAVVLRYLAVNVLVNGGQAVVVGLVMWWLKMPSPVLWAVFTFVLEFIPYLGATVLVALLAVVAFATFPTVGRAVLPPVSYLVITTLQNNVVSPIAYGKRLKLNPVAVLIAVLFWGFVWDIPGAFLAVPIVATLKVIADRTPGLRVVGEFLGE